METLKQKKYGRPSGALTCLYRHGIDVTIDSENHRSVATDKGKALRSVGIMIAQNGYEENAFWTAKGCFRENGKLIILLSTNDLIEINKLKAKGEEPSDYLLMILDDMLLTLEK